MFGAESSRDCLCSTGEENMHQYCQIKHVFQCYSCDGIKQSDSPCAGSGQIGEQVSGPWISLCSIILFQVSCADKCGLLLEERLTEKDGSVVSSDSRWRRGCATDGHEMTDNSEADGDKVTGEIGCLNVGQYSYDNIIVVRTFFVSVLYVVYAY